MSELNFCALANAAKAKSCTRTEGLDVRNNVGFIRHGNENKQKTGCDDLLLESVVTLLTSQLEMSELNTGADLNAAKVKGCTRTEGLDVRDVGFIRHGNEEKQKRDAMTYSHKA